jgi:hypothetical protein
MNNKSITDFIKPTIITAQQYGTKVSVEIDHSDTDVDELMYAFQTLIVGLGYSDSAWKNWIVDRADEYREDAAEEAIYEPSPELRRAAEAYVKGLEEQQMDKELISDFDCTLNDGLDEDDENEYKHEDLRHNTTSDGGFNRKNLLAEMMEDDEQLGLYDDAIAEHNAHEEGFSIDGGFDGKPIKSETGTIYFSVPVNYYADKDGSRVYDYEGMADQFEEQLSELDKSAVVMVSVETHPVSKELIKAAKKYKKKLKTQ